MKKEEQTKETMNEEEQAATEPEVVQEQASQPDDWKEKYVRLYADFDNYKKRAQKDSASSYSNGVSYTAEKLLPVMDNFERAMTVAADESGEGFVQGISMIQKQLSDVFSELGIVPIEAVGKTFDPNLHNAVMHVDDESFGENEITEEFIKGYMIKDKVLRHSVVKVAN